MFSMLLLTPGNHMGEFQGELSYKQLWLRVAYHNSTRHQQLRKLMLPTAGCSHMIQTQAIWRKWLAKMYN